jgi:cell division septum initiation protein DivIVA
MADEPTKEDVAKLDAKIKELTQRHDSFHDSVDEYHKAAEQTKSATTASAKDLANIKQRK